MLKVKIEMTHEVVTENYINIQNDNTSFCRIERITFPNIHELEKEIKTLRKQLKNMNVSLYRTDTLKTLKEQKEEYTSMVNEYNNTFDQLVKEWTIKLKEGIYTGYVDDEHLNKVINPLEWKLQQMNYRSTLLSKIRDVKRKVEEVKRDINTNSNCTLVKVAI